MLKIGLDDLINLKVTEGTVIGWPAEQDEYTGEVRMIEPKVLHTVLLKASISARVDVMPPEDESTASQLAVETCRESFLQGFKERIIAAVIHDLQGGPTDSKGYQIRLQPGLEKPILIISPEQYAKEVLN